MTGNVYRALRKSKNYKNLILIARNCRHILAAQKEAENFELTTISDAAAEDTTAAVLASRNAMQSSVSYISIPPPEWCRIPTDSGLHQTPFHGGRHLPNQFPMGNNCRCSCGATSSSEAVNVTQLTIYTSFTAIETLVETSYCVSCRNTKGRVGPDLGEYGLLNWNNRIAFSHELMNSYTSEFTTSETPMYAFHQTVRNTYTNEQSPASLCSLQTFVGAYFAFIRLQAIESKMECIQCGPDPPVVIADGISVSFPKHRIESLCPPTVSNKLKAMARIPRQTTKATCYTGPHILRVSIQKALDEEDATVGKAKLLSILADTVCIFRSVRYCSYTATMW